MEDKKEVVDLREIFKSVWERRRLFFAVWIVVAVLSALLIFPVPRYYNSEVSLAPESSDGVEAMGGLSSIASSLGFNLGGGMANDAFYPLLYPDILSSTEFVVSLFDVKIRTLDGTINTDYYTYRTEYVKKNPITFPLRWLRKQLRVILPKQERTVANSGDGEGPRWNPFLLSEADDALVSEIRDDISCDIDIKTNVITIKVQEQDPLVCALMADSIRVRLQNFITDYRTSKSRIDVDYYTNLVETSKAEFKTAADAYGAYADSHRNSVLESARQAESELENEMDAKYQIYQAASTQLQAVKAKLQERTPAFTILQCATVPVRPSGPKRMIFIAGMLILSTFGTIIWIFRKELVHQLLSSNRND